MKTLLNKHIVLTSILVTKSNLSMRKTAYPNRSITLLKQEATEKLLELRNSLISEFKGKSYDDSFIAIGLDGSIKVSWKDKDQFNVLCSEDLIAGDVIDIELNLKVYEHPRSLAIKAFANKITIITKTIYKPADVLTL